MFDQKRGDDSWRVLTDEEKDECKQWAQDHYEPGGVINHNWHPVVKGECEKMNDEGGIIAKMGDFAISEVSTREVSTLLFNDKILTPTWKGHAQVCIDTADGNRENAKEMLAASLRNHYANERPLDGDCTIYDSLLGWALTTVDWPAIASDFVDAVEYE